MYVIKNHEFALIPTVPIEYHRICDCCCYTLLFFSSSAAISFSSPFTLFGVQIFLKGSNAISQ